MVKIFYRVDQDYGSRVEKGLSSTSYSTMFEKFTKKLGLTSD